MEDFATQNMLAYIKPTEIKNNIKALQHRKSPGADLITNQMLKKLPNKAITFLTNLFNGLLNIGYFPLSWKKAIIIVLNKPGKDKSNPENYRPICLLTAFSKLFEKCIQSRLLDYLNSIEAIPKFQFGFKSHHSTTQQQLRLTETINNGFENKNHTGAVFLDIAKAFDRVWHDGLFYKLKCVNMPRYILHTLKSFLSDRRFAVRINEAQSSCRPIQTGVLQGSKLGHDFYISDIPLTRDTNIALFADDTTIYCNSSDTQIITTALQKHLNKISPWCQKWKIIINPSKSQAVFFSLRRTQTPQPVKFDNESIDWKPSVKYLGVILDKKLNWRPHISAKLQQAYQRLGVLFPIINRKSTISKKCSLIIYKQVLRPLILYACPIWGSCANSHLNKIQIYQNKILRIITDAPWFVRNKAIHKDLNIPTINEHINHLSNIFFHSLKYSNG
ncbi:unnamed protein product [Macrosiphum euphorbiae]|uniref:Reverse transcriptase domain-containing protein n=1 Tax=Macrosiphum euphorbiae TaxID=13131 RepID=A0AAV0Y2J7_9HEMI|nr:unnamed protein product [Macrosiphum euphorbiae]